MRYIVQFLASSLKPTRDKDQHTASTNFDSHVSNFLVRITFSELSDPMLSYLDGNLSDLPPLFLGHVAEHLHAAMSVHQGFVTSSVNSSVRSNHERLRERVYEAIDEKLSAEYNEKDRLNLDEALAACQCLMQSTSPDDADSFHVLGLLKTSLCRHLEDRRTVRRCARHT